MKAEECHSRALTIREKILGKFHVDVARSLHNLSELYFQKGKYEDAENFLNRALEIQKAALGENHPKVKKKKKKKIFFMIYFFFF